MGRRSSPLQGRLILVVGSRRSGTQLVQRLLSTSPFVASVLQETHLFSDGIAPLLGRVQSDVVGSAQIGTIYADERIVADATRDLCDAILAPHLAPPAAFLIERTPVHAFHLDLIGRIYPDAAVVHVIRDGRDVARSLTHQPWGPDSLRGAAAAWRDSVVAARAAGHPRYLEIRYEELVEDGVESVLTLFRALGVPPPEPAAVGAELARVSNTDPTQPGAGVAKWRTSYSDDDLKIFHAEAGDLLVELGYAAGDAPGALLERASVADGPAGDAVTGWRVHDIHGDPPNALFEAQSVFERFLGALCRRDTEALAAILGPKPQLLAHGYPGVGAELTDLDALVDLLATDDAFDGVQLRGDVVPSFPVFSAVLDLRTPSGRVESRVVYAAVSGGRVRGVVLYRLSGGFPATPGHR